MFQALGQMTWRNIIAHPACAILSTMSLSRRGFLQRLVRPGKKTPEQRRERYEVMAAYVRTNLLPYDFGVSPDQEAELFAAVRRELENTNDEELFSSVLRFKVEEVRSEERR